MPVTNAGRESPGQNKTSSAGHGLWQRTRRAVSGGMSAVCSRRALLAAWGAAAHGEVIDSEALESGSPGRAAAEATGGEISAMGGTKISVSGNSISLRCG